MAATTWYWDIEIQTARKTYVQSGMVNAPANATKESIRREVITRLPGECRGRDAKVIHFNAVKTR